ncbi:hypothetical protein NM688_g475 [Phlebia brevispora]|uniref:Uncharacterized protein n=1 Tax=Phlebia brevispora TaxID=194682 RepID=A0ACC1TE86_9APHY|nr:hypothetical protein NM688_g475 [Phlebia brevispora]
MAEFPGTYNMQSDDDGQLSQSLTPSYSSESLQGHLGPIRTNRAHPRGAPYSYGHSRSYEDFTDTSSTPSRTTGPPLSRSYSSQESMELSMQYTSSPLQPPVHRAPLVSRAPPNTSGNLRGILSAQKVDRLIDGCKLGHQREKIHAFLNMGHEERDLHVYLNTVQVMELHAKMMDKMVSIEKSIAVIKLAVAKSFTVTKGMLKMLGDIARHFVIQPNATYVKISSAVSKHVAKNCESLGLLIYGVNEIVREQIDKVIRAQTNEAKSSFNKKIKLSVEKSTPLSEFTAKLIKDWHLTPKPPKGPTQAMLASFALLRKIAAPHVQNKISGGSDSGNWPQVEEELTGLYALNGNKRTSNAWIAWEKQIIAEDEAKYTRNGAADQAFTWEEMYGSTSQTAEGAQKEAADGNDKGDDENRENNEEQHVDLASLDLAKDITPCERDD